MSKKAGMINVQEIAKAAAIEALKLQKDDERQRLRKNRFHNTELLLKNYLSLAEHLKSSIDKTSDIIDIGELTDNDMDDIIIQSIMRSKMRTLIMICQLESSLEILRLRMNAKGQSEKYSVIQKLYLDLGKNSIPWTDRLLVVATEVDCGESSVRRWRNEMITELSVLLFGVDGLKLEF